MGANLAALGTFPKSDKKNKVYYVNRLDFGFSVKKTDANGKRIQRTNQATGLPVTNSVGEPEFVEESVMFKRWVSRFNELGYWCGYEVTANTPKAVADELKRMAESKNHQVMDEKAFVKMTNPALADHIAESESLVKEREELAEANRKLRDEKNTLDQQIANLKQKAGIK